MNFSEVLERTRKLYKVYESLGYVWNGDIKHGQNATFPIVVTVEVLLNNMCFAPSFEDYERLFKVLEQLNEYNSRGYMTHFVCTECYFLIESYGYFGE